MISRKLSKNIEDRRNEMPWQRLIVSEEEDYTLAPYVNSGSLSKGYNKVLNYHNPSWDVRNKAMSPEIERLVQTMARNNETLRAQQTRPGQTQQDQIKLLIEALNNLKGGK